MLDIEDIKNRSNKKTQDILSLRRIQLQDVPRLIQEVEKLRLENTKLSSDNNIYKNIEFTGVLENEKCIDCGHLAHHWNQCRDMVAGRHGHGLDTCQCWENTPTIQERCEAALEALALEHLLLSCDENINVDIKKSLNNKYHRAGTVRAVPQ